jgi:hypothetical protein
MVKLFINSVEVHQLDGALVGAHLLLPYGMAISPRNAASLVECGAVPLGMHQAQ